MTANRWMENEIYSSRHGGDSNMSSGFGICLTEENNGYALWEKKEHWTTPVMVKWFFNREEAFQCAVELDRRGKAVLT